MVWADDALHWQAECLVGVDGADRDVFEMFEQRETGVPRGAQAGLDDVVSIESTDRDGNETGGAELLDQRGKISLDPTIDYLREIDEVHLVDRDDEMADAKQGSDVCVTTRLREDALARIDEDDGEVCGGGAGGHVAGVLLVARGIGNDELATLGREVAVGYVDGDALLTLGAKPVCELGEVDSELLLARRSDSPRDGADLIFESYRRRPMRVDLPSSTLPAVLKRSRSLVSSEARNSSMAKTVWSRCRLSGASATATAPPA